MMRHIKLFEYKHILYAEGVLKGVVHFKKKKILTPMSSKMSTSFFLQSKIN